MKLRGILSGIRWCEIMKKKLSEINDLVWELLLTVSGVFAVVVILLAMLQITSIMHSTLALDEFWSAAGVAFSTFLGVISYQISKRLSDIEENREIVNHRPCMIIKECARKDISFDYEKKYFMGSDEPVFLPQKPSLEHFDSIEGLQVTVMNTSPIFCRVKLRNFTIKTQEEANSKFIYRESYIPDKVHDLFLTEQQEGAFCFVFKKDTIENLRGTLCAVELNLTNAMGEAYRQKIEFYISSYMNNHIEIGLKTFIPPYRLNEE